MSATQNYVLRSVYISPKVDDTLRELAFTKKISKNDLIRKFVEESLAREKTDAKAAKTKKASAA